MTAGFFRNLLTAIHTACIVLDMITTQDWDTVARDGYTQAEQNTVDAFINEHGAHYQSVTEAIEDARALGLIQ